MLTTHGKDAHTTLSSRSHVLFSQDAQSLVLIHNTPNASLKLDHVIISRVLEV